MASDMDPRSRTVICVALAHQITKNEKRDLGRVSLWPWCESDGENHLEAYGGGVLNWHILGQKRGMADFFTLSFGYLKSLLLPASVNFQNSY